MPKISKTISIASPEDFEDVAADLLDDFTSSFSLENGCAGPVDEDGRFLFTWKGQQLYERYQDRLRAVGERLFPGEGDDMRIKGWMVREDADWDD